MKLTTELCFAALKFTGAWGGSSQPRILRQENVGLKVEQTLDSTTDFLSAKCWKNHCMEKFARNELTRMRSKGVVKRRSRADESV